MIRFDNATPVLLDLLKSLDHPAILGTAESCASGTANWPLVRDRIEAARAAIRLMDGRAAA